MGCPGRIGGRLALALRLHPPPCFRGVPGLASRVLGRDGVDEKRRYPGSGLGDLEANEVKAENRGRDLISAAAQKTDEIMVPVAITVFPDEVFSAQ